MDTALKQFMKELKENKKILSKQQYSTIKGQALAGDIEGARKVLYLCLNMAKSLAIVASPIMPNRTTEIWTEQLAFAGTPADADKWEDASKINVSKTHKVNLPKPLFARIDDETIERYKATFSK